MEVVHKVVRVVRVHLVTHLVVQIVPEQRVQLVREFGQVIIEVKLVILDIVVGMEHLVLL